MIRISSDGKVSIVYRADAPYFPNGVFTTSSGDLYVLEVGFIPPSSTIGPRVRKISANGKNELIATIGENKPGVLRGPAAQSLGVSTKGTLQFFLERGTLVAVVFALMMVSTAAFFIWRYRRRKHA